MFCCWFVSHHDIITQPQLHFCYIIKFSYHISTYFLQAIVFLIHFHQTIVHLIYISYHSPSHSDLPYLVKLISHCYSTLLSLPPFSQSRLEINNLGVCLGKVLIYVITHHLKLNSLNCLFLLLDLFLYIRHNVTVIISCPCALLGSNLFIILMVTLA